jgi:hypothetical protein
VKQQFLRYLFAYLIFEVFHCQAILAGPGSGFFFSQAGINAAGSNKKSRYLTLTALLVAGIGLFSSLRSEIGPDSYREGGLTKKTGKCIAFASVFCSFQSSSKLGLFTLKRVDVKGMDLCRGLDSFPRYTRKSVPIAIGRVASQRKPSARRGWGPGFFSSLCSEKGLGGGYLAKPFTSQSEVPAFFFVHKLERVRLVPKEKAAN